MPFICLHELYEDNHDCLLHTSQTYQMLVIPIKCASYIHIRVGLVNLTSLGWVQKNDHEDDSIMPNSNLE